MCCLARRVVKPVWTKLASVFFPVALCVDTTSFVHYVVAYLFLVFC